MDTLRAALALVVVAAAAGCHPTQTLIVHPLAHANGDRRFYLVVRALDDQQFVNDGYQHIAELVFPAAADPSVKLVRLVSPGHDDKVTLRLPGDQSFAVYALFTQPGESWKVLLTPPLASRYELVFDGNRVAVRAHGRRGPGVGDGGDLTAASGLAQSNGAGVPSTTLPDSDGSSLPSFGR